MFTILLTLFTILMTLFTILSCQSLASGSHDSDRRNRHGDDRRNTEEDDETEYGEYLREICTIPGMGHRVLVIQPGMNRAIQPCMNRIIHLGVNRVNSTRCE